MIKSNGYVEIQCHQFNRRPSTGLTDGYKSCCSCVREANGYYWSRVTGLTDAPIGLTDAHAEKGQRLLTATLSWWAIYMGFPGHLKLAGVSRSPIHTHEHFQATQELSDKIFSP